MNEDVTITLPTQEELKRLHVEGRCSFLCPFCYDEACRWAEAQRTGEGDAMTWHCDLRHWLVGVNWNVDFVTWHAGPFYVVVRRGSQ